MGKNSNKDVLYKVSIGGKSTPLPPPRNVTPSPKSPSSPSQDTTNNKK